MNYLGQWLVLCWNIRGLNAKSKQLALMNAINVSGYAIICLQETKKSHFDMAFIKSCCLKRFDEFVYVPSDGASGGFIIIRNTSIFTGLVMHYQPFALSVHFTSKQADYSLTLLNIYGPCSGELRDDFVSWLYELNILDEEDWLIVGGF